MYTFLLHYNSIWAATDMYCKVEGIVERFVQAIFQSVFVVLWAGVTAFMDMKLLHRVRKALTWYRKYGEHTQIEYHNIITA